MNLYQLTNSTTIIRTSDGAQIPNDPANADYAAYLAWVAAGNTPDPVAPPIPLTLAEQLTINEAALQAALDSSAQAQGYIDIKSACAYASPTAVTAPTWVSAAQIAQQELYRHQGNAAQQWMSLTWAMAYVYFATVEAGTNPMPTPAQAVAMMPPMAWPT